MYLITTVWRGTLNIGDMRSFSNPEKNKALAYYKALAAETKCGSWHSARGYMLSSSDSPKLIWSDKKPHTT